MISREEASEMMRERAEAQRVAEVRRLRAKKGTTIETVYKHWVTNEEGFFHVLSVHDHNGCSTCSFCKEEGRG